MTRIRLLVSDIDGTLVRSDKTLSDAVVAATRDVLDAGIAMTLISARPPSGMIWIAERLGLEGALGAFNGGTIFRSDGTIMAANRLDPELAGDALERLDKPGVTSWLYADGRWFAQTSDNPHVPSEIKSAGVDPVICADFSHLLARVDKLVGVSDDYELLAKINMEVARAFAGDATVAQSQPYYLDITAPRANKGDGLRALADSYGAALEETAALGDQNNDLPMFAIAGLTVAMGQASATVKAAAMHISQPNDDDGVADAIKRFILPANR
ncbi:MAG: HAD family hydrolase [Sphingomonadales bacterium]